MGLIFSILGFVGWFVNGLVFRGGWKEGVGGWFLWVFVFDEFGDAKDLISTLAFDSDYIIFFDFLIKECRLLIEMALMGVGVCA